MRAWRCTASRLTSPAACTGSDMAALLQDSRQMVPRNATRQQMMQPSVARFSISPGACEIVSVFQLYCAGGSPWRACVERHCSVCVTLPCFNPCLVICLVGAGEPYSVDAPQFALAGGAQRTPMRPVARTAVDTSPGISRERRLWRAFLDYPVHMAVCHCLSLCRSGALLHCGCCKHASGVCMHARLCA